MQNQPRKIGLVRLLFSGLLTLLFLAMLLPSTGRVVKDNSTTPATFHIEGRFQDATILIGMVQVPLGCIYIGARRLWALEIIGWVLLVSLFIPLFQNERMPGNLHEHGLQIKSR